MKRMALWMGAAVLSGLAVILAGGLPAQAVAVPCTGSCAVQVTATVPSTLTFSVTIVELVPNTSTPDPADTQIGPVVTAMDFGTLASNGTFDPDGPGPLTPQPRALNSTKAFQVFFGINAQQRPFTIQQSASPLQSGGNQIPSGAFVVDPLDGVGGDPTVPLPSGTTVGSRQSAIGTNLVLFSRAASGASNTMAATYGITDNPALEVGTNQTIPLDQPAGTYSTVITYSATAI